MDRIAHVIPMGLEIDRVIGGLKKYPTNLAVLVRGTDRDSKVEHIVERNIEEVSRKIIHTINVELESVEVHDFQLAFVGMRQIFSRLNARGYSVHVNLSTGTRITSSASLIAAFIEGATPYYVIPEEYNLPEGERVLSTGVKAVVQLPTLGVLEPSESGRTVLSALQEHGGSIDKERALFDVLMTRDFFPEPTGSEDPHSYDARRRAKLNRTFRALEENGFVTSVKRGRSVSVKLTESGRLFLDIGGQDTEAG